ncbi:MAG: hypothetical protein M1133_02400 [Armatimonadetes bacterium]|nr:hypothetical protein [Armatimonadota bacterium]
MIEIYWPVNRAGYMWELASDKPTTAEGPGSHRIGKPAWRHIVVPKEEREYAKSGIASVPAAYRLFAETDPTPAGILEFANNYGLLGGGANRTYYLGDNRRSKLIQGESLQDWQLNIESMRAAVALWHSLNSGHRSNIERALREVITINRDYVKTMERDFSSRQVALFGESRAELEDHIFSDTQDDPNRHLYEELALLLPHLYFKQKRENSLRAELTDAARVARLTLYRIINAQIQECSPSLRSVPGQSSPAIELAPHSLHDILWLQLSEEVLGKRIVRQCVGCGKWIEVVPGNDRLTKSYCGPTCRNVALRKRQAHAKQLYKDGMPLEGIARQVDTDVATVEGWVTRKRGAYRNS